MPGNSPKKGAGEKVAAKHRVKTQPKVKARLKAAAEDSVPARGERYSQFTLKMRESLHQQLARLSFESGMTMRGYIMTALKDKGLKTTEEDLVDRRKRS